MAGWLDELVDGAKTIAGSAIGTAANEIDELVEGVRSLPPVRAMRSRARGLESGVATGIEVVGKATGSKDVESYGRSERQRARRESIQERQGTTKSPEFEKFTQNPSIDTLTDMVTSPDFYKFVKEQAAGSVPDMAAAIVALPVYIAARTGEITQERAANEGRPEDIRGLDFIKALPAGTVASVLERVGGRGIISPKPGDGLVKGGMKAGAREGATEAVDESVEYAGESVGTEKGFDPKEARARAIGGAIVGGPTGVAGGAAISQAQKLNTGQLIRRGASNPDFAALEQTVLGLEGGGTLANPKVSPKGAKGPMQVMPATARDPGFGIRPWDGKTEADRARVGRQYLAAMTARYDGDHAKILAAYNAGPGRVDNAVKKYGDNWLRHMPNETKKYVVSGLQNLGVAGRDGGPKARSVPPMDPAVIAEIMNDPEAARMAEEEGVSIAEDDAEPLMPPAEETNVTNMEDFRSQKDIESALAGYQDMINDSRQVLDIVQQGGGQNLNLDRLAEVRDLMYTELFQPDITPELATAVEENIQLVDDIFRAKGVEPPRNTPDGTQPETGVGQGQQNVAANDPDLLSAIKGTLTRLIDDERGSLGYRDGSDGGDGEFDGLEPDQKIKKALKKLEPAGKEQRRLYREARSVREAKLRQIQERNGTLAEMKAVMKGELPKLDYKSIGHHFTPEDREWLRSYINSNNKLYGYQKARALEALENLLGPDGAKMPTDSERELLSEIFGEDIFEGLFPRTVANILNIPRAVMASADFSAPFRQGVVMVGRKEFYTSLPDMVKSFGSQDVFDAVQEEIRNNPYYELFVDHKLALTMVGKDARLQDREEAFMTRASDHIPIVKQSNRAYVAYLNKLRADVATSILRNWYEAGVDIDQPKMLDALMDYINTATGRGNLGSWNRAAPLLNTMFFSTRLIASRAKLLWPGFYWKLYHADPEHLVFKEAAKDMTKFAAAASTALALAALAGASIEDDPTDAKGLKVAIKNSVVDVSGGIVTWVRLYANIAKFVHDNYVEGEEDKSPFKQTAAKRIIQFLRNKTSPIVSLVIDFLDGKDAIGEDFGATMEITGNPNIDKHMYKAAISRMTPMITQSAWEAYHEHSDEPGPEGLILVPLEGVGMSVNTYKDKQSKPKGGSLDSALNSLSSSSSQDMDMVGDILEDL